MFARHSCWAATAKQQAEAYKATRPDKASKGDSGSEPSVLHRLFAKATQLQFVYVTTAAAALVRECGWREQQQFCCVCWSQSLAPSSLSSLHNQNALHTFYSSGSRGFFLCLRLHDQYAVCTFTTFSSSLSRNAQDALRHLVHVISMHCSMALHTLAKSAWQCTQDKA